MSTDTLPDCASMREKLLDDLAGPPLSKRVEEHLAECFPCRSLAEDLGRMFTARRSLAQTELTRAVEQRVFEALGPSMRRLVLRSTRRPLWPAVWGPRLRWAWAFSALVLLTALLWRPALHWTRTWDRAQVARVSGSGLVVSASGARRQIGGAPLLVTVDDTLETGRGAQARIDVGADALVLLAESKLALALLREERTHLRLDHGGLVAEVQPTSTARQLTVAFAQGDLIVTGTVFQVQTAMTASEIAVVRGGVRVRLADRRWFDVEAGQRLRIEGAGVQYSELDTETRDKLLALLHGERNEKSSLEPDRLVPERPATRLPTPGRPATASAPEQIAAVTDLAQRGQCSAAEHALGRMPRSLGRAVQGQLLVRVADCYYGAGDGETALRLYRRAADDFSDTQPGENAGYEVGRLLRQSERTSEAQQAFAQYLARYPRGALAAEALFSVCTLALDANQPDEAVICLRRYRQRFPKSKRVIETYLLEATALRTGKSDCRGAIEAYDRYLQGDGEYTEQARRWRQWCETQLVQP